MVGLACTDTQQALQAYCSAHPAECRCDGPVCCIQPGAACETGQACCSGDCTAGRCPGTYLGDAGATGGGSAAPAGGGASGGRAGGAGGATAGGSSAGGAATAGGGAAGGSATGACSPGFFPDGGEPAPGCSLDGGCPNGVCCRGDRECSSSQCLVDRCTPGGVLNAGDVCNDVTDCVGSTRCDTTTWPRRCVAPDGGGGTFPNGVLCGNVDADCTSGACYFGICRPMCTDQSVACSSASACCEHTQLQCTGTCVFGNYSAWANGARCDFDDQCSSGNCMSGFCAAGTRMGNLALGAPCALDSSCASSSCVLHRCAAMAECSGRAESCLDDTDCCAPYGCRFSSLGTYSCVPTFVSPLAPASPCVIEDNSECRFPGTRFTCRMPGQMSDGLACCVERLADGGPTSCLDAGTCACAAPPNCTQPVDAGSRRCPDWP